VLIKLTAAALNFRDFLITTRSPAYPGDHKANFTRGADGAGIISTTGPLSSWAGKEGTHVVLQPAAWLSGDVRNMGSDQMFGGTDVDGTLQSWMVVDDARAIAAPKGWKGIEIAGLVTAGSTAWGAIRGGLDERLYGVVLTQGTGCVSCAAIQIATALRANIIPTSSSDSKLKIAKSISAAHLINYRTTPDWDQEVHRITKGKGVDHVIEVGGAQTMMKSLNSTQPGGLASVISILTESEPLLAEFLPSVLFGAKVVKGCCWLSRDTSAEFIRFEETNNIKPVIAKVLRFN
ncbi:NAD(P)-binding protein, partial [Lindgomyces ingoldianus]